MVFLTRFQEVRGEVLGVKFLEVLGEFLGGFLDVFQEVLVLTGFATRCSG